MRREGKMGCFSLLGQSYMTHITCLTFNFTGIKGGAGVCEERERERRNGGFSPLQLCTIVTRCSFSAILFSSSQLTMLSFNAVRWWHPLREREIEGMEGRIKLHSNHSRGSLCKIFTSSFSCNKHSSQLLRTCDNKLAVLYLSLVLLSGIIVVVMVLNISGNQSRFSGSTQVWIFW